MTTPSSAATSSSPPPTGSTATRCGGSPNRRRPPPPAAADTAVGIRILGKKVKVNRKGIAKLRLRCPAGEATPPCRGRLVLRTRSKQVLGHGKRAKKRRVVLAKQGFKLGSGKTKVVRVKLGKRQLRLVRAKRRARQVLAIARVRDAAGNRRTARKKMQAVPVKTKSKGSRNG